MKQMNNLRFLMTFNISLIFTHIVNANSEKFEKDTLVVDMLCDSADIDLGSARSVTSCAGYCVTVPLCKSFFFVKDNKQCKGSSTVLGSTIGCYTRWSSVYFKSTDLTTTTTTSTTTTTTTPASTTTTTTPATTTTTTTPTTTTTTTTPATTTTTTTPATTTTTTTPATTTTTTTPATTTTTTTASALLTCYTDAECTSSTNCVQGLCQCNAAGYSYDPDTGSCVTVCANYGSTYNYYPDMALSVSPIASYSGVSLTDCKKYCSNSISCRGFNYCISCGNLCRIKAETPLTNPLNYYFLSSIDYYFRNCA